MKYFLRKTGFFGVILLLLIIVCGVDLDRSRADTEYMAAIIDKHQKLKETPGKRILFAGGSNIAFGVDSKMIEDQVKIPVINLGIHVRLGLSYMLNELKSVARQGDVIFLSLEYFLDEGNYKLKRRMSSYLPESSGYFAKNIPGELAYYFDRKFDNIQNNRKIAFGLLTSMGGISSSNTDALYSRNGFNANGDFVAHFNAPKPAEIKERGVFKYTYWNGIKKLNDFYTWARANQVKVFFLYPAYPLSEYNKNKEVIRRYDEDLQKDLLIPVVSRPGSFVFDDGLFFDTIYHLNEQGIQEKTNRLLQIIASHLRS